LELVEYLHWIRQAPAPTEEQLARFARHVLDVHSWYKGSLLAGTELVVFLDPNLYDGEMDGREITDTRWIGPREQRRVAFGALGYLWRAGGGHRHDYRIRPLEPEDPSVPRWDRGRYPLPRLPPEVVERCGMVLYPYVRGREFISAIPARHTRDLQAIRAGREHPGAAALRSLDDDDFEHPYDAGGKLRELEQGEQVKIARALQNLARLESASFHPYR